LKIILGGVMTGRGSILWLVLLGVSLIAAPSAAEIFGTGDNQFTIDFVSISANPGETHSTNTSGDTVETFTNGTVGDYTDPGYDYRMGTYEITNDQWNKFEADYGTVTGNPLDAYDEDPYWTGTDVPTNELSWYEAAQFVNWLNTSTGHQAAYKFTGTQGTTGYSLGLWQSGDSGYDADNPYRNSNAYYFIPTEDEWVKAAYWNGSALQTWSTPHDTQPIEDVEANYHYEEGDQPWNVGSGSEELNSTFDMMGNVWEWMESPRSGSYFPGSYRGIRGGMYSADGNLRSSDRIYSFAPFREHIGAGFRVASVIPEPTTLILFALGSLLLRKHQAT
jgi:formylglycine-generating enzyme required for sulfatase activity